MPDFLLVSIIVLLFIFIVVYSLAAEDGRLLVLFIFPLGLMLWLIFAAIAPWEVNKFPCTVSVIQLPNGGKRSTVAFVYQDKTITQILPYTLDNSKKYIVGVRNCDRLYRGVYFIDSKTRNEKEIDVQPISPEVDK